MNKQRNYHFVNLFQSNEERREKYHLLKSLGCNYAWARAMRDWPLVKIQRRFDLPTKPYLVLQSDGTLKWNSAVAV